jgi:ubiquinone biosynthesis protein UbiJ
MVMPSLALEWMLSRAQALINALLVHGDAEILAPFHNQRIRFLFEPMMIAIDMTCTTDNHIILSTETPQPVALTLRGTPVQFLKTLSSHTVADLHITGDGKIAQSLQRVLGNLNIDAESFLETLVGGTLAHTLFSTFKKAQQKSNDIVSHTIQDISDYCQYETQTIVSQAACDAFTKDVNELRYTVDHLAAKIAQLKRRIEDTHVS